MTDELKITTPQDAEQVPAGETNPADETLGMEARQTMKALRVPAEGLLSDALQEKIRAVVRDHIKHNKLTFREVSAQAGYGESTISSVLKGTYTRADNSPILRKLNSWMEDDERRRRRKRPIGFYPTCVFETIRGLAQYAKSNARIAGSQRHPVVEHDPARIAVGWGPGGCGKTLGAQALHAEDPLSVYIRVEQKAGTDSGLARLIIDAMLIRGACDRGMVRFVIDKLRDSGRLLIVDEAHRLKFSGCEFLRDLSDVCGIPILLLATQEIYDRLTRTRQRTGDFLYDQFARRVCHMADLLRGLDGKGGVKRPIFSLDEVRQIYRADQVRISPDAYEFLQDTACTPGLGMLSTAANIFEKAHRSALRGTRTIRRDLLRKCAERVLIPAGKIDPEPLNRIDQTGVFNRRFGPAAATATG